MRPVQYLSDEYLEQCKKMSLEEIVEFLENFRILHSSVEKSKSKLISIKIPEALLEAFKTKSKLSGVAYQTQMKVLMQKWLSES